MMKNFLHKYEKIVKILFILLIFLLISVISTVILSLFGVIYYEDGVQLNRELFDSFKTTWYGCVMVIFIQVVITSLLSFVPGTSMAFIMLVQTMYDNPWLAFLLAITGVFLSSSMMYLIGRFGGYSLCKKLLGEEDCDKASDLLNNKGTIFFPLMMMFPMFPDDALVMVAGTLKMSLKWFIPSIIIGRGIGVATIIFGLSTVPFEKFTSVWHWVAFVLACAVGIGLIFFGATKLNKYLNSKKKTEEQTEEKV